jgi:hypothetical protein
MVNVVRKKPLEVVAALITKGPQQSLRVVAEQICRSIGRALQFHDLKSYQRNPQPKE